MSMEGSFLERVGALPRLGLGVSTEYGARRQEGALDPAALRARAPEYAGFLEVGVEVVKGLDADASAWAAAGRATTYHFLDVNLDEPEDLDPRWLAGVEAIAGALRPAWVCGDAGLWHFGARDRGQMLLLPPILMKESIGAMAAGIRALRAALDLEVLPENPPGSIFLGDLHLLEFFAGLAEAADTGLLIDCAHLAIYQRVMGYSPLTGFDSLPWERVVELHVAGGSAVTHEGLVMIDDDHGTTVLPETWQIVEAALARAKNLKAVVVECERNPLEAALPLFEAVAARLPRGFVQRSVEGL